MKPEKIGKVRGLKLISEEALIQEDVGIFVSARAGIGPKLDQRPTFKTKHITSYWFLLSIACAWPTRVDYVSVCRP